MSLSFLGLHLFVGFVEVVVAAAVFLVLDWWVAAIGDFAGFAYHYADP